MVAMRNLRNLSGILKITFVTLIAIFALGIYEFALPIFVEDRSDSFAVVGIIFSLVFVASMLMEIPTGFAVDKYGRIKIFLLSMVVMGVLGIVYYFTENLLLLALLSLVFGTVVVAFYTPSAVLIRDVSPRKMLSLSEGLYMGITQLGWIFGPVLAGIVTTLLTDKHNFLLVSVFMFAAAGSGLAIFMGRRGRQFKKIERGHKHKARLTLLATIFKEYLKIHKIAPYLYFLCFAINAWVAVEWAFVPISGMERFGFSETWVGLLLGMMMAIEGVLYYSAGYIMDKIGKKYIVTGGFLLLFSATYFMFLSTSPAVFMMAALLAAATPAWILPGVEAYLTEIVPANVLGEMSGAFYTSQDFGLIVGPLASGFLAVYLLNPLSPFLFVALLAGAAALVAGYVFWPAKEVGEIRITSMLKFRRR